MWPSAASATTSPISRISPVKHCELALYVRDDHPLASADTITFAELNDVDLHTYRRGTPIGERVAKML